MSELLNPMGHRYDSDDLSALETLARRAAEIDKTGLDIGAWSGQSTLAMLGKDKMHVVEAIDTWKGDSKLTPQDAFWTFRRNMRIALGDHWKKWIRPQVGRSCTYAHDNPTPYALIFIDADMDKAMLLEWLPHVMDGGILCGASYNVHHGVTNVVNKIHAELPGSIMTIGRTLWWLRITPSVRERIQEALKKATLAEATT